MKYLIMLILLLGIFACNVHAQNENKLPFVGSIVNIETYQTYFQSKENELDASVPNVRYNKEIDEILNKEINEFARTIISAFFEDYNEENHQYTKIDYEIITDSETWFTLKLIVVETAASSDQYFKYYHIDKNNNKIVILDDLFQNKSYKTIFVNEIKRQMEERMLGNSSLEYWVNKNGKEEFKNIDDDQNFYFDKDGNIVIVFNKYEVGPGSIGVQEFKIASELYKEVLK